MSARIHRSVWTSLFVIALFVSSASAQAQAQNGGGGGSANTRAGERVDGDIKGTVGLGLLGFELGFLLTPTVGLHDATWAWYTLPAVGAAAGATVGYFVFEAGSSPDRAVTLGILGSGMGLLIPAVVTSVWIANKRRLSDVRPVTSLPPAGLLSFDRGKLRAGSPAVAAIPRYSDAERQRYGVTQRSELRIPLVSGRF